MAATTKVFTLEEVARHKIRDDVYLAIKGKVYDATKFLSEHPGGEDLILEAAGEEATEAFEDAGHTQEAWDMLGPMLVGEKPAETRPAASTPGNNTTSIGVILAAVVVVIACVSFFYMYQAA